MPFEDEWGRDPSVQSMRRIFSLMEEAQQDLLKCLNIPLLDQRLRGCRKQALELFERTWPLAVRKGIMISEKDAAPLYLNCLARALSSVGIEVPKELLSKDEKIICFVQKELS
jgi:hypothetical protein